MFYKVLGYLVWNGGKVFLRQRYGSTYVPKPMLVGGTAAAVALLGLAAAAAKRNVSD